MNNLRLSRDGRKVQTFLSNLCAQHHKSYELTPMDALITEYMMIKLYPAPVINIIKTRAKKVKFESKHGTLEYWIPMLINMIKSIGTRPNMPDISWIKDLNDINIFSYIHIISNYLLTDYSYEDLIKMMEILSKYEHDEIINACRIGKLNDVYEVRYIAAVLEKERAREQVQIDKKMKILNKAEESDKLLDDRIHRHTIMDIAYVQHHWHKTNENHELEKKFNDIASKWGAE